jgi:serine/threonine protein kinase
MYKLLTGKLPFDASNNYSMIYHTINIEPPPASSFRPEMPPELDRIVQRAMEKDTAKRYKEWEEFANDLVGFTSHTAPSRKEILDTEKFDTLRSMAFFKNFSDVELWEVLRTSVWRKVPEGEYILRSGESGRIFYILAHGVVRVIKEGRLLSLLHRGDCFGEMAHLLEGDYRRSSDVVAKNDVSLIEINSDMLIHATTGCRLQFSEAFLRMLAKRLSVADTRISLLLADHNEVAG